MESERSLGDERRLTVSELRIGSLDEIRGFAACSFVGALLAASVSLGRGKERPYAPRREY
ncbi:MAG: hypothetical protein ACRD18_00470 [Terriglobia bacterium]